MKEKFKMYHGECIEIMKKLESKTVDLILCDLPYGTTDCKWDNVIPFDELWNEYERVIKINGAIVLFSAQPFTTKLINSNFKLYRYTWYWIKNNTTGFVFAKYQPMRKVEEINVFYKKMPTYNPQGLIVLEKPIKRKGKKTPRHGDSIYEFGTLTKSSETIYKNYPNNVLNFKKETNSLHPTQKPVSILEYLIKTYTNEGEIVLDNCMGSGSTGVACANTNRKFIGIEKEEKYFEIATERVKKAYNNIK